MILKNETQGSFVIVSQMIMHDKSLKLFDRGLLITLMSLRDNWEFSINGLARIVVDGRDAISKGIERLQKHGYLKKEQLRENGKFSGICLRIIVPAERPVQEKPVTENPPTGKSSSDCSTQYKNNKLNNKESNNKVYQISSRKGVADNGASKAKQNDSNGSEKPRWSKKEIDLYGL